MRLRRSDTTLDGYARRRRGGGFSYHDAAGRTVDDPDELARVRSLVIPPAWRDVWICRDPYGHIQATGVDAAGRRQYLYHEVWRAQRDAEKFDHVLEIAAALPRLRRRVAGDLAGEDLTRARVLATAARLLDLGAFRIGCEEYAAGDDATFGLATLRRDHVSCSTEEIVFSYPAKGGVDRLQTVADLPVLTVVRRLKRRRTGEQLLAYRDGRVWRELRSGDINDYLREASGEPITAKDFRTWHATNLTAVGLAVARPARSTYARKRVVTGVLREVAEFLGNTPAVARSSYVDPRVFDLYHDGITIDVPPTGRANELADLHGHRGFERQVLALLRDEEPVRAA